MNGGDAVKKKKGISVQEMLGVQAFTKYGLLTD